MNSEKNAHGLSRHIPESVARDLRRACGFGCVFCGLSIVCYEHIDPEFHEAKTHDPECMALLCGGCHDKVTRRFWSKEKISSARRSPACKQTGFSWGEFDFESGQQPYVTIGGCTLRNCAIPIAIGDRPVISIESPEEPGAPFRLSAFFCDEQGTPSLLIQENQWKMLSGAWDAECVGGRIEIRARKGPHSLILRALPPNGISVEVLRMRVGAAGIDASETTLRVQIGDNVSHLNGFIADDCKVGISLG